MSKATTVLYVEDDPDIRAVTELALEDEGFELVVCGSGLEAIEQAANHSIELLLLDVMMPGLNGLETLAKLREQAHLVNTPVIFMTAKVQPKEIARYKTLGATGVINKPFEPMALASELRSLLSTFPCPVKEAKGSNKYAPLQVKFMESLVERVSRIQRIWNGLLQEPDKTQFEELNRNIHSLAGAAGSFGFSRLGKQAHKIEAQLLQSSELYTIVDFAEELSLGISKLAEIAGEGPEFILKRFPVVHKHQRLKCDNMSEHNFIIYMLEDDLALAKEISRQLSLFGYTIEEFVDLAAIRLAIKNKAPDALLLDINLREGRTAGSEFAAEIRSQGLSEISIIFMSGYDSWSDRLSAVRASGQAFLAKPVNFDELAEILDILSGKIVEEPYRIFIIDDTVLLAEHYAQVLQAAGMKTTVVNSPENLLELLAEFSPDLILMDLYMPNIKGTEAAAVIRQHRAYTDMPICYLSTERSIQKQLDALKVGGDDFLQKPLDDTHLVAAVTFRVKRFRQLKTLMNTDGLTGLLNHVNLKHSLERELSNIRRRGGYLCFGMIDIDQFKLINDQYGHPVGDRVLKSLARLFTHRLRSTDLSARYGGEEFAIILRDTTLAEARHVLDEVRHYFAGVCFTQNNEKFTVTFSAGLTFSDGNEDMQSVISAADKALYKAKKQGRNRVVVAAE